MKKVVMGLNANLSYAKRDGKKQLTQIEPVDFNIKTIIDYKQFCIKRQHFITTYDYFDKLT